MDEEYPKNVLLVDHNYDENPLRNGICSWMYTCASYVAVPFVAAARSVGNYLHETREEFRENRFKFITVAYTACFELAASGFNGWGVGQAIQAIIDAFIYDPSRRRILGVYTDLFIACVVLAYLSGICASRTHIYTNKKYNGLAKQYNLALRFLLRLYTVTILTGDFYDHATGDVAALIAFLETVWPGSPALFKAIFYPMLLLGSSVSTIKEWSPCKKNVLEFFYGNTDGTATEVKLTFLTTYTMAWTGCVAMVNGYGAGQVFDLLISGKPFWLGLSGAGITFWIFFGVFPAGASTYSHFIQWMGYDTHAGYTDECVHDLNWKGRAFIALTNLFDYFFHTLDYATTPVQITELQLRKIKAPVHFRALAASGIVVLSAGASWSETSICFEENKKGTAILCQKRGIFQTRAYLPLHATPLTLQNDSDTPVLTLK